MTRCIIFLLAFFPGAMWACHGMMPISISVTTTTTDIVVNASSDPATCGCGPYYLEVEASLTNSFTGAPPAYNAPGWNVFPWYHELLDIPGYGPPNWVDQCALEPYKPVLIPLVQFCAGSTVYLRLRENVAGGGTPGPWSSPMTVVVPSGPATLAGFAASTDTIICPGDTALLSVAHNGCSGNYTVSWSPTSGLANPSAISTAAYPSVTTTYSVTFTDNSTSQSFNSSITLFASSTAPTASASSTIASCSAFDATMIATVSGGVPPLSYLWSTNDTTLTVAGVGSGSYQFIVTDSFGCTAQVVLQVDDSCDYVWPGDADDDAIADMNDILAIGIANGATGTTRPSATLTWIGQWSAPWGQTLANGTDYKWTDCNGDGTINATDTTAVMLNYGLTHNNRYGNPLPQVAAPLLWLDAVQDTIAPSSQGTVVVNFGNGNEIADSVYGILFSINYDEQHIDPNSIAISGAGSWMGTIGTDLIAVKKVFPGMGRTDIAITRMDQATRSDSGAILNITFNTSAVLVGTGQTITTPVTLSGVRCISNEETPLAVNLAGDSIIISDLLTGVGGAQQIDFSIQPNPATEQATILFAGGAMHTVYLYNALGEMVFTSASTSGNVLIDLSSLSAGMYFVQVASETGVSTQPLLVAEPAR